MHSRLSEPAQSWCHESNLRQENVTIQGLLVLKRSTRIHASRLGFLRRPLGRGPRGSALGAPPFRWDYQEVRVRAKARKKEKNFNRTEIMKTTKLAACAAVALAAMLIAGPMPSIGQTNLNFNGISANVEGAIRLSWNSTSNEIYEVDEADALGTNTDGSTAWNSLYSEYPSQGTNTFWLDTGNYDIAPAITHPKYSPMRFYRIVYAGTNTAPNPSVTIISPTNGNVLSDQITVSVIASSSLPR